MKLASHRTVLTVLIGMLSLVGCGDGVPVSEAEREADAYAEGSTPTDPTPTEPGTDGGTPTGPEPDPTPTEPGTAGGTPTGPEPDPTPTEPNTEGGLGSFDSEDTQDAVGGAASNDPVSGSVSQSSLGSTPQDTISVSWTDDPAGEILNLDAARGDLALNSGANRKIRNPADTRHKVGAPSYGGHGEAESYELIRNDVANDELSWAIAHVSRGSTDNTNWLALGYWLHATDLTDNTNREIHVGAFVDGPEFEPRDATSNPMPSTGDATFTGKYGGLYSSGVVVQQVAGNAELSASFTTAAGRTTGISGTITIVTPTDLAQSTLDLAWVDFTENGWIGPGDVTFNTVLTGGSIGTGKWGGQFSTTNTDAGEPHGVGGTAGVSWTGTGGGGVTGKDGAIVGYFVANQ